MDLVGQRVLVVGLGRSGQGAARLAVARGAEVVGVDLRTDLDPIPGVTLELGPHPRRCFDEADVVVVSPGIPPTQPDVAWAMAVGKDVVGELGFAARFLGGSVIAVTGTNGKSTVTWFTGQLLAAAGVPCFVGGNLGNPLSDAALDGGDPDRVLVVEVSSYQLETKGDFAPDVAVILNLTPDHLARHGDMDGYAAAKARVFEDMGLDGIAILPAGDVRLARAAAHGGGRRAWMKDLPGILRDRRRVRVALPDGPTRTLSLEGFGVPGAHNLDNAAIAAFLALAVGADFDAVQRGIDDLTPLAHRMEVVHEAGGIRWINDSKATNLDAAKVGISGLAATAVVLLGGQGKPNPDGSLGFAALAAGLARHRGVVAFGEAGPAIATELTRAGLTCLLEADLDGAVRLARGLATPGDAVLLSPGCASFDAFEDFEARGRHFIALARRTPDAF